MTALVGKSTTLCHALIQSESQLISRPGSGEIVHPATTDGTRRGGDSGVTVEYIHTMVFPAYFITSNTGTRCAPA
jgi:hypothetical protein